MKTLDGKFFGTIIKNKNQQLVPDDRWMVFLAQDNALPATLRFYYEECARQGAARAQLESVEALIRRVDEWRVQHPEYCKTPDVDPGEIRTERS